MSTGLWWGNLKGRDHFEELRADGRIISKCMLTFWRRNNFFNFSTPCI